ncbi:MAG TPA: Na+/H+ antiporter NhaA, partial [Eggerthellaceae bacterium]|nr:Na+/H+ antiporter NhaA [Eggerthellaceae bacterium]
TMAIFVANLAFPASPDLVTDAKIAILSASTLAGIVGFVFLMLQAKAAQARGVAYLTASSATANSQTAGAEAARKSSEMLDDIDSPLVRQEIEEAQRSKASGSAEVVVELGADDEE